MKDRRDKCKCGKMMAWDTQEDDVVICSKCHTEYEVDCDSVLVYWLIEKMKTPDPWRTEAR